MKNSRVQISVIVAVSFCLALALGMLDYETRSLWHLLTAEAGNLVALAIYTLLFSTFGFAGMLCCHGLWQAGRLTHGASESNPLRPKR